MEDKGPAVLCAAIGKCFACLGIWADALRSWQAGCRLSSLYIRLGRASAPEMLCGSLFLKRIFWLQELARASGLGPVVEL